MSKDKALLAVAGASALKSGWLVAANFTVSSPWFFLGLTCALMSLLVVAVAFALDRRRTLEEEFDAGYRAGYRAGRKAPRMALVKGGDDAGVSTTAVWPLPGHGAATGRSAPDSH